jgi:hypothetical protein
MTLADFVVQHPWWTLVYLLVIGSCISIRVSR